MIIRDLDPDRSLIGPNETDPVLIVDPDTLLPNPVPREHLKPVARWHTQVREPNCGVELLKLPGCYPPQLSWTTPPRGFGIAPVEDILGSGIFERANHKRMIAWIPCYGISDESSLSVGQPAAKWTPYVAIDTIDRGARRSPPQSPRFRSGTEIVHRRR